MWTSVLALAAMTVTHLVAPASRATVVADNLGWILLAGLAAWASARATRRSARPWSLGWGLLATTTAMWTVANVGWAWYEVVLRREVPSV
ncbi:MAG TPA: hypothetical protein VEA78_04285, partial [Acidimicrobiales bacterium]|nr:hypothetical protein [Acidimicrobiales bacterium]